MGKDVIFSWGGNEDAAFSKLKELLASYPVLLCPNFKRIFTLCTDASSIGLGAVLEQEGHAVAYFSRALRGAESRYSTVELECLAIVESLKRFRHYLIGRHFQILADHKPLEWLSSQKSIGKLWRWALIIQEFDFKISYRPGHKNDNADALSRLTNYGSVRECSRDDWATHNPENKVAVTEISNVPDLENTRFHQLNDHILCKVIHELETIPINKRFCGGEWKTDPLKRFKQIKSQLRLKSGVLVRSYKTDAFSDYNEVIVTPECMKKDLLIQADENGGHQGVDMTLYRLKLGAYWVGINRDVELHVSCCETCQKAKLSLPTKVPLVSTPVGRTMQLLQVDVLEVPISINRNRYLLVVEDAFSKWIECYPMKDQKAETITNILVDV